MCDIKKIEELFDLYKNFGNSDYIGERISQVDHMIQAAMNAEDNNAPDFVVLACLFHDIGHLLALKNNIPTNKLGVNNHEHVAYKYLKSIGIIFPIPELVRGHVMAKRFLVSNDNSYYDTLSESSKKTLEEQGGKLSDMESNSFASDPLFEYYIQVRKYDDSAKKVDKKIRDIEYYKNMCINMMVIN